MNNTAMPIMGTNEGFSPVQPRFIDQLPAITNSANHKSAQPIGSDNPKNEQNNNISIDDIMSEVNTLSKATNKEAEYTGLFIGKPANQWIEEAKNRPIPKMLFGEFWHEGELCILFANTNLGKSILAVQIANSVAKGIAIPGLKFEARKQKIL